VAGLCPAEGSVVRRVVNSCTTQKVNEMTTSPKIVERTAQPYVAIKSLVSREEIGPVTGKLFGEVFGWLGRHGLAPAGAPFFRYGAVDMEQGLEIEFGVPTAMPVAGDNRVLADVLPAGRYASLIHRGPYEQLYDANGTFGKWIEEQGLKVDVRRTPEGDKFGCRLEVYLTDPAVEKDPQKWETEVAFKLAS
jgi:effector-binding domain-containing protein